MNIFTIRSGVASKGSVVLREVLTFYNNLGNLLSLKRQPQLCERMEFRHSLGKAEKQDRYRAGSNLCNQ
jgi:hypothetical protein